MSTSFERDAVSRRTLLKAGAVAISASAVYLLAALVLTVLFGAAPDDVVMAPLVRVERQYLAAAFDAIVERYDSVERYLETVAGVGAKQREALKNILLE